MVLKAKDFKVVAGHENMDLETSKKPEAEHSNLRLEMVSFSRWI